MGKSVLHVLAKRSTPDFAVRDRDKEKRKKILKMCVQKLRDIDDPETVLCRAVLINNTFKSLKYAYRHRVVRPEPEPEPVYEHAEESDDNEEEDNEDDVSTDDSSNSDDESVQTSSSDNDSDTEAETPSPEPDTTLTPLGSQDTSYCPDELDTLSDGCDLKNFNAESIVHSLMMPPLLSPQLEDMTNCSFYDTFSSDLTGSSSQNSNKANETHTSFNQDSSEDINGTFKFSVVNNVTNPSQDTSVQLPSLSPVSTLSVHSSYSTSSSELDYCQKSDFPTCVQSDIGNSILIDNLLTEIVQA